MNIVTCMSLVQMIGFISSWVTHVLLITLTHWQYSTLSHLHNLQFTVANALDSLFPLVVS
jgi:hypothetical protein